MIQIDEANITAPPDEGEWAAAASNVILDAATRAKEKGVHLCFGNYGGQSIQRGERRPLIGFLNRLHCDHLLIELAFRGYSELQYFKDELDPRIGLGLGVIDIKASLVAVYTEQTAPGRKCAHILCEPLPEFKRGLPRHPLNRYNGIYYDRDESQDSGCRRYGRQPRRAPDVTKAGRVCGSGSG